MARKVDFSFRFARETTNLVTREPALHARENFLLQSHRCGACVAFCDFGRIPTVKQLGKRLAASPRPKGTRKKILGNFTCFGDRSCLKYSFIAVSGKICKNTPPSPAKIVSAHPNWRLKWPNYEKNLHLPSVSLGRPPNTSWARAKYCRFFSRTNVLLRISLNFGCSSTIKQFEKQASARRGRARKFWNLRCFTDQNCQK